MQKPYLLLRNNQQTGPYSLEEIIQLNLKPFDLVWVEGRSAAWRYPGEVDALKAYVPAVPQPEIPYQPISTEAMNNISAGYTRTSVPFNTPSVPKNVFVSFPGRSQEASTSGQETKSLNPNELKNFNAGPSFEAPPDPVTEEEIQTHYRRPVQQVEEDYTNWVFQQRTKKKTGIRKKQMAAGALFLVAMIAGYWFMNSSKQGQKEFTIQSNSLNASKETEALNLPATSSEAGAPEVPSTIQDMKNPEVVLDQPAKRTIRHSTPEPKAIAKQPSTNIITTPATSPELDNRVMASEDNINSADGTSQPAQAQTEKEKKKKVRDMIREVFSKKDKKTETAGRDPNTQDEVRAENRQTARREEAHGNNEELGASIADQLYLSSNAPDNWMMGITGLKLTLRNNSQANVLKAAVTVLYFNENNQLLDQKTVYFTNVAARGKTTIAAPDHKFADHAEFRLGAVSARSESIARQ